MLQMLASDFGCKVKYEYERCQSSEKADDKVVTSLCKSRLYEQSGLGTG